jgi:hypothetical protein
VRGGIVSVEPGEAYRIDTAHESDDLTVTMNVVKLSGADTNNLPLPSCC